MTKNRDLLDLIKSKCRRIKKILIRNGIDPVTEGDFCPPASEEMQSLLADLRKLESNVREMKAIESSHRKSKREAISNGHKISKIKTIRVKEVPGGLPT